MGRTEAASILGQPFYRNEGIFYRARHSISPMKSREPGLAVSQGIAAISDVNTVPRGMGLPQKASGKEIFALRRFNSMEFNKDDRTCLRFDGNSLRRLGEKLRRGSLDRHHSNFILCQFLTFP